MTFLKSVNYKHWVSEEDEKRCKNCEKMHGKIYQMSEFPFPFPPLHFFCRCRIEAMDCIEAGTATNKGLEGADFWLSMYGVLPDYYITEEEAKKLGFNYKKGNLGDVAFGKMLVKGEYENRNGHLPIKEERTWYEADINYVYGHRGNGRILFSNDGLIFVTYDHYYTFKEINPPIKVNRF